MTGTETYQSPAWIGLLFASPAAIAAAPESARAEYVAFVDALVADPAACGFRTETAADLQRDLSADRHVAGFNQDWG